MNIVRLISALLFALAISLCQSANGQQTSGSQSIWPNIKTADSQQDGRDEFGNYAYVESFEVNGIQVHAYEYDNLVGPFGRIQAFWIMNPGGPVTVSQGSYDLTTQVAREMGEIGSDERLYHVDLYRDMGPELFSHTTLAMTLEPLAYEDVKNIVIMHLQGDGN